MTEDKLTSLSESVQMYLVSIARLRAKDQPVALSLLAETLSISPVSANEMCRRLQDQGLVIYQPYRGVWLTEAGEERACYILRRHRLWEVLLVGKLGFAYDEAHDMACQLEHATPDDLANRLDAFLDFPPVNPMGEPIFRCSGPASAGASVTLATLSAGQRGRVVRVDLGGSAQSYMDEQGIRPGAALSVVATAENSILVQVGQAYISLARHLAQAVQVRVEEEG